MDKDIEHYYIWIYIWLRVRMGRVKNDMDEDIENYYIWIYIWLRVRMERVQNDMDEDIENYLSVLKFSLILCIVCYSLKGTVSRIEWSVL